MIQHKNFKLVWMGSQTTLGWIASWFKWLCAHITVKKYALKLNKKINSLDLNGILSKNMLVTKKKKKPLRGVKKGELYMAKDCKHV